MAITPQNTFVKVLTTTDITTPPVLSTEIELDRYIEQVIVKPELSLTTNSTTNVGVRLKALDGLYFVVAASTLGASRGTTLVSQATYSQRDRKVVDLPFPCTHAATLIFAPGTALSASIWMTVH